MFHIHIIPYYLFSVYRPPLFGIFGKSMLRTIEQLSFLCERGVNKAYARTPSATFCQFFMGRFFFLSTVIITKNPTRGRVNVTVIEVALQEQDDGIHQEYKVFFVCIYDEASYKQLRYPVFCIWVFFFGLYLQVKHPLQLKARILRKVELFLELETSLIIFS